jgi:NAD+ kinase
MPEDWVLASVQKENIASFMQFVIDRKYTISKRTLLSLTVHLLMSPSMQLILLNEITVSRKDTTSMITIDTYLNEEYLNSYWADGLFQPHRIYRILAAAVLF